MDIHVKNAVAMAFCDARDALEVAKRKFRDAESRLDNASAELAYAEQRHESLREAVNSNEISVPKDGLFLAASPASYPAGVNGAFFGVVHNQGPVIGDPHGATVMPAKTLD